MQITRFHKVVSSLFLFSALLIGLNVWLAFHAEEVLASSENWVTHTLEVLIDLEHVLHTAAEAESAVRGYVLTKDDRYLGNYRNAVIVIPRQFALLTQLSYDNPKQVARIQQASRLAAEKLARLGTVVELTRTGQHARQVAMMKDGTGRELMMMLADKIQEVQAEERHLLAERLHGSAYARIEARLTVALASLFDLLFAVLSICSLSYERRLRRRAAEATERLQKLQAVTEIAFTQLTVSELTTELLSRLRVVVQTDVLVLCPWYGAETELTTAEGTLARPGERRPVHAEGAMTRAAQTGCPVRVDGDELQRLPLEGLRTGLGSALVLPMMVSSKVIAMLVAGRERSSGFSADDERLLALAADRIALALDRAAAYEAERIARKAAEAHAAEIQKLNEALEERVRLRTAELETTNRELEAFSYSVSHDLRAPLRTVDGFSVALEEDYGAQLEGDGKHYLKRIRVGVQRMGQLIDALLQLSRITRAELSNETVDLSALAASVAEEIGQRSPSVAFTIEENLCTEGDSRLLRTVFENMFGNAAKFTGKVAHPKVSFGWSPEREAYFVSDNGAGFDQQYAGKLFVAFQRLHGDKDFQGTGIGLATVARVIARHHGHIWAEAVEGHGATFWFTLG